MTTSTITTSHLGATHIDGFAVCDGCGQKYPLITTGHDENGDPEQESPAWAIHARRFGLVQVTDAADPLAATIQVIGVRHVQNNAAYRQCTEREGEVEVDPAVAATIASWWASSGPLGSELAALATGAVANVSNLLGQIATNRDYYVRPNSPDALALDMLGTWVIRAVNSHAQA